MIAAAMRRSSPWFLASAVAAQTTWIVETGNPGALPSLAAAVAAASDGDVIRIRNSVEDMSGITITKSLRIVGEGLAFGQSTVIAAGMQSGTPSGPPMTISVGAGKEVCISHCSLGFFVLSNLSLYLSIDNCQGRVVLEDCAFGTGVIDVAHSHQVLLSRVGFETWRPAQIVDSTVVFDRSTLRGRRADYEFGLASNTAATIAQSTVHCVDSRLLGGNGSQAIGGSLPGSHAITLQTTTLTAAGTSAIASGTLTSAIALHATGGVLVLEPGITPTMSTTNTMVLQQQLPSVLATNVASGQTATLQVRTPSGSLSALLFGLPGDRRPVSGVLGDLWLDPQLACTPVLGVQNGSLAWTVAIPPSPALFATPLRWQGAMLHQGVGMIGAPGASLLR